MKHIELSDFFIETFTYAKQMSLQHNEDSVNYLNENNNEEVTINLNNKKIVLTKLDNNFILKDNKETVFSILILDEPDKEINVEEKHEALISNLKNINIGFKNSLGIKNWLSEQNNTKHKLKKNIKP